MKKNYKKRFNFIKKQTKWLAMLLVATQCMTTAELAFAAPQAAETGKKVSGQEAEAKKDIIPSSVADIFDAEFYREQYPDVAAAVGNDPQALLQHFLTYGLKEGRSGSPILDIAKYRSTYADLASNFGDNWDLYVQHYFRCGISEGRSSGIPSNTSSAGKGSSAVHTLKNGISYDDKGNVIIPWENIEKSDDHEEYLTLEALRARCGDTLVLLTDKDGKVTFVGGNFSDVKVKDIDSAIESLHCMMKLLNFPEDTAELYLTHVNMSANGELYYRFSAQDKNSAGIYADTGIVVGVDVNGKVLCLSSSSGTRFYDSNLEKSESDDWADAEKEMNGRGFYALSQEAILKYNEVMNQYAWVKYYKNQQTGIVAEYYIAAASPASRRPNYGVCYYKDMPTSSSYSFDYFFENDIDTQKMTFTDYYENSVELSVAWDKKEQKYYILDKERHIVGIEHCNDYYAKDVKPYYFEKPEDMPSHYVSSLYTVCTTYDYYKKLGLFDQPKALLFDFDTSNPGDEASCAYGYGALEIEVSNHVGNAAFDVLSHELAHGVLAIITGNLKYQNKTGAINESYADILGNLLEMITYQNGANIGDVDTTNWTIEEAQKAVDENWDGILRSMSDPNEYKNAYVVGGKYYIIDADDEYAKVSDNGGVHINSGILNYICYRMNKDAGIPMEDLFKLWYDTLYQLNEDTDYESIRGYMEYTLRRYHMENKIEKVNEIFADSRVSQAADTWAQLSPADNASKIIFRFRNMPETVNIKAKVEDGPIVSRDKEKVYGLIMAKGDVIKSIEIENIEDDEDLDVIAKIKNENGYTAGQDTGELVVDYDDILAAALTGSDSENVDEILERYENRLLKVTFTLEDERSESEEVVGLQSWSILLDRKLAEQEGVNVTVSINVPERNDDNQDVILKKNSKYNYFVTVKDHDGNSWSKLYDETFGVNTAELEKGEDRTVTVIFTANEDDGWKPDEDNSTDTVSAAAYAADDSTAAASTQNGDSLKAAKRKVETTASTKESGNTEEGGNTEESGGNTEESVNNTEESAGNTEEGSSNTEGSGNTEGGGEAGNGGSGESSDGEAGNGGNENSGSEAGNSGSENSGSEAGNSGSGESSDGEAGNGGSSESSDGEAGNGEGNGSEGSGNNE